jgi:hypothetical protein
MSVSALREWPRAALLCLSVRVLLTVVDSSQNLEINSINNAGTVLNVPPSSYYVVGPCDITLGSR